MMYETYESPLSSRYASEEMLHLFSQKKRVQVWRKLWTALARAEHNLGLPITAEQVDTFLHKVTPALEGASGGDADIDL